jgi:hypothetical protein
MGARTRPALTLFLVSLAGLLLEVGYTRITSYKLWYYYTYLVIGLALLGIGSGGIFLVLSERLKRASTDAIVAVCSVGGAVMIAIGYVVVARLPIDTLRIWDYGAKGSYKNIALLGIICFTLFVSFVPIGMIVATVLGRARDRIDRLYFADLVGAGLGCFVAVWLISHLGPPTVIMIAALVLAVTGVLTLRRSPSLRFVGPSGVALALALIVAFSGVLPDVKPEHTKLDAGPVASATGWGPVFRVDAVQASDKGYLLVHDGTFGAALNPYNCDPKSLTDYDSDSRSLPYRTLGRKANDVVIIGSAGGNEVLTSLHYGAKEIHGVELNPVTLGFLKHQFADFTCHLYDQKGVHFHNADGRAYLARSKADYDLIWYVAPDSYAANNAASSGAFVLSESYLYTSRMIQDSLKRLTDDGIMVVQFGELDYANRPNRTARYVVTARDALHKLGVRDPQQHLMIATFISGSSGDLSTIMVKRTPFTEAEVQRFKNALPKTPGTWLVYAPGTPLGTGIVPRLAVASDAALPKLVASYPRDITAVTDDAPFFWHFSPFSKVLGDFFTPMRDRDPEDAVGERVLLLLLGIAALYAAAFLIVPFFAVREKWKALPAKGVSGVYFAALGLGFMFFEITMIQRLTRFLGYPTYSLTVTLASILVATGVGALASKRLAARFAPRSPMPLVLGVLAALTLFYQFGFDPVNDALLSSTLFVRVVVAWAVLFPLGFCLGMFMPLGLTYVGMLSEHGDEYVAWGWAVNGFFSVIGSVLTTILSMTYGFRVVQFAALGVYAIAVLAFTRIRRVAVAGDAVPAAVGEIVLPLDDAERLPV